MDLKDKPNQIYSTSCAQADVKIKVEETFPCDTNGCNIKEPREHLEPEHALLCLLVKILQEFELPKIHIAQICTILSKSYKYFYNMPPYILVGKIKDLIEKQPMLKEVILNEDDPCVLLSCDTEAKSLGYVKQEIKLEHDVRADSAIFDLSNGVPESSVEMGTGTYLLLLLIIILRVCYQVTHSCY